MMYRSLAALALLIGSVSFAFAQVKGDSLINEPDNLLEFIAEDTEAEFDYNTFLEDLEDLKSRPLNLNKADFDELSRIFFLSPDQIGGILRHRDIFGNFLNIYELQAVRELDLPTIYNILPYVRVRGDIDDYQINSLKELLTDGDYQLFIRYTQTLEEQKGYTDLEPGETGTRYLGSPFRLYTRFRYNFGSTLSYGFTAEKDPGEEFFRGTQKQGFDYYSGHIFLRDIGPFKHIAVGDYEVKLGQGLLYWSGFGFGKSAYVLDIKRDSEPLKPYTSVNENNFLRGVATTVEVNDFQITAFGSSHKKDANLIVSERDTLGLNGILSEEGAANDFSSLQQTGYHSTPAEIADKHNINETVVGGSIKYRKRISHIAFNAAHTRFSGSLDRSDRVYNKYDFSGQQLTNFGMDYSYLYKNLYFFGEYAMSDNMAFATVHGLLASLSPQMELALTYRYYEKDYQALVANGFGETSKTSNENGIYSGLSIHPNRHFIIDTYIDYYQHPWLRFNADAPSHGVDYLMQVTYRPNRQTEMYVRYKNETKQENAPANETHYDYLTNVNKQNLRFHVSYTISKAISMKNRFEIVRYNDSEPEYGYLVYQDLKVAPLNSPISFNARFAVFKTESFDANIYAYENDVLYSFSVPAYYNDGTRFYIVMKYHVSRSIDFWLRFSQTYFANVDEISSGLNQIDGNSRSEIKAQVRFKF